MMREVEWYFGIMYQILRVVMILIEAMKINLGEKEPNMIKEFSFSINDPDYEKTVTGTGPYKTAFSYDLLPDFTGDSKSQAQSYANAHGIKVTFKGDSGYVVSQSLPANKRIDLISGSVVLTLSGSEYNDDDDDDDDDEPVYTPPTDNTDDEDDKGDNGSEIPVVPSPGGNNGGNQQGGTTGGNSGSQGGTDGGEEKPGTDTNPDGATTE